MIRSIQWTLQLWHAGLMALVLAVFGTFTYVGVQQMQSADVDKRLEQSAQAVMARFGPGPRGGGRGGPGWRGPDDRGGGGGRGDFRDFELMDRGPESGRGQPWGRGPMDIPSGPAGSAGGGGGTTGPEGFGGPGGIGPDGFGGPGGPGGPGGVGRGFGPDLERFTLPEDLLAQSGQYCVVWRPDGTILQRVGEAVEIPDPGTLIDTPMSGNPMMAGFVRTRGEYREAVRYGPRMTRFVVGKSLVPERAALHRLGLLLAAAGAGVLMIGLAGGWMLSARAVRPIGKITRVAQEVSASNLSRRIDLAGIPSEFVSLAAVLNETFARLEAAFAQQVRFTADASHELRTPLSVIHTHAQLALSRERNADEYKKTIATCLRASNRMKSLVDSLLLLASADAGRLTLDPQPFDLRDVVEECVSLVLPLGEEKKVQVIAEPGDHEVEIEADMARVSQVMINLLSNGIRYNVEGGKVTAKVGTDGEWAVLSVADTGVGILAEHQAHLFERFYRVDKARSREVGGSGLGLAIVKQIVEAHGGVIEVKSEVGKGTEFQVRLPRKARERLEAEGRVEGRG